MRSFTEPVWVRSVPGGDPQAVLLRVERDKIEAGAKKADHSIGFFAQTLRPR